MTDRELLELAAKAASYVLGKHTQEDAFTLGGVEWNPLLDDGDALRLAVKLNISVLRPVNGDNPDHFGTYAMLPDQSDCGKVRDGADPYAATRRAIVRAAAEIGKAVP